MIDRRLVEYFDWWMLTLTVIAGMIGLVALYSAVNAGTDTHPGIFTRQLIWYSAGTMVMVAVFLVDFKVFRALGPSVLCAVSGVAGRGARVWNIWRRLQTVACFRTGFHSTLRDGETRGYYYAGKIFCARCQD